MRVTALDARLPPPEPLPVLFLRELAIFPEKKVRLSLVGRPEDISVVNEPFLEQLVCGGIDVINAAILVIGNPDQEAIVKSAVSPAALGRFR